MELKWLVMSVRAVVLSLCAVMAFAGTASAELIVAESGNRGSWDIVDSDGTPGGRCGYGAETASGVAALKWIRLFGPSVKAFNRTSAVDQQKVSFQVKVMRRTGSGSWSVVASSGRQARTARGNAWTEFDPIRVYVNGAANHGIAGDGRAALDAQRIGERPAQSKRVLLQREVDGRHARLPVRGCLLGRGRLEDERPLTEQDTGIWRS